MKRSWGWRWVRWDDYLSKPVRYHELMAFNILFREILAQDKDCISAWRDKITSKLDAIPDN